MWTPELKKISQIQFGILSPDEIRKMAVTKIITADTYNEDGTPIEGGLIDRRLGTIEPGQRCKTCGNQVGDCPGHFGMIELSRPVVHVGYAKSIIYKLLRSTCRACSRILLDSLTIKKFQKLIENAAAEDDIKTTSELIKDVVKEARKKSECPHCSQSQYKVKYEKPTSFYEETPEGSVRITPSEIQKRFEEIQTHDLRLLGIDAHHSRPEWMILSVLPVPPVSVRASITLESGVRSEDDLTHKLVDIIRINQRLRENIEAGAPQLIVEDLWELLQYHVTTFMDNEVAGIPPARHRSGRALRTLTQRLRGKEGRFRGNLSGKRVDFSARTVVSPDPNISINEVGVPEQIAKILTVPERVTEWNIEEMKELVMNGPNPEIEEKTGVSKTGSNYIIRPDGKRIDLRFVGDLNNTAEMIDQGFIVERHLRDGDMVLFNRQPSLHRMSIMAHEVRVMPFKTFRLHLCVCVAGDTPVLTNHGKMPIANLVTNYENDNIAPLSCDKDGEVYFSGVKKHYIVKPNKIGLSCYRIKTNNGRIIDATQEHPFYTSKGIKKAGTLKVGERLAIYPIEFPEVEIHGTTILTREQIINAIPDEIYEKYTFKELEDMELLNISCDSKKQIDLASLVGHLFGDGTLLISYEGGRVTFRCSEHEDIRKLYRIVESLGMKPTQIKWNESKGTVPINEINGNVRYVKGGIYVFEVRRKPVAIALKALGVPVGDKTTQSYGIPKWILDGSKMVKRAFLRSYFGAEMSTPRLDRNPKRFRQQIVKFFKTEDIDFEPLKSNLLRLLKDFNVEVTPIRVETGNIRKKDGKKTSGCVITLVASDKNLLEFFENIGFEFAQKKEIFARNATEYLRFKLKTKSEATELLKRTYELKNLGHTYEQVADEVGVSWSTIASWHRKGMKQAGLPSNFPDFEEWKKENTKLTDTGFVWDKIISIEKIDLPQVYDITTNDENHNFIAGGGFLTMNCTPYNADFDGDEMNLHVPQSEEARAETRVLMRVQEQILSPRYGGPIIGALHDYVSASFLLTRKKTLISKEDVWQLLLTGNYEGELPPPAISHPVELWTGKQVFSLLLPSDVNVTTKSRTCRKHDVCKGVLCEYDSSIYIRSGQLLSGVIDRRAIGADESESVLHVVVKDHGSDRAREFLDSLTQMLLEFLSHEGFSLGFSNVNMPEEGKKRIRVLISENEKAANDMIEAYHRGELEPLPGKSLEETLEMRVMSVLAKARDSAGSVANDYMGISNSAVVMASTGAKGTQLNIAQMAACVGQQSIRGERILRGYRKRSLPHFQKNDIGPIARGFVRSNYRTGLSPTEFFFHAQGGREGLVDTAVRTSTSGYLQRRLVNALQDLHVNYDIIVRTTEGDVVQLRYGEDGVDPMKSYHGRPVDIDAIIEEVTSSEED